MADTVASSGYRGLSFYFAPPLPESIQLSEVKRRLVNFGAKIVSEPQESSCFHVFTEFSGSLFEKLSREGKKKFRYRVIGWQYLVSCVDNKKAPSLEADFHPKFSDILEGYEFSFTQIHEPEKSKLMMLARFMSAAASSAMTTKTTRMICGSTSSDKYVISVKMNIPTLRADFLHECWKQSKVLPPEKFMFPALDKCVICTASLSLDETSVIQNSVPALGGVMQTQMNESTTHLVTRDTHCKKYLAAQKMEIPIVTPAWINECFKRKVRLPESDFHPTNQKDRTSTDNPVPLATANLNSNSVAYNKPAMKGGELATVPPEEEKPSTKHQPARSNSFSRENKNEENEETFLRSCSIALKGFHESEERKLQKLISMGGATFDSEPVFKSTTHIVVADATAAKRLSELHECQIVSPLWLQECIQRKKLLPASDFAFSSEKKAPLDQEREKSAITTPKKPRITSSPVTTTSTTIDSRKREKERDNSAATTRSPKKKLASTTTKAAAEEIDQQMPSTSPDRLIAEQLNSKSNGHVSNNNPSANEPKAASITASQQQRKKLIANLQSELFMGKVFFAKGFLDPEIATLDEVLSEHGGVLFWPGVQNDSTEPAQYTHYILRPHGYSPDENDKAQMASINSSIVTTHFIEACLKEKQIVDPDSNILYRPMRCDLPIPAFQKLRVCITDYDPDSTDSYRRLLQALGARVLTALHRFNLVIAPNDNFSSSGSEKIKFALTHRIPIVNSDWLRESAIACTPLPPGSFLQFSHAQALPSPLIPRVMALSQSGASTNVLVGGGPAVTVKKEGSTLGHGKGTIRSTSNSASDLFADKGKETKSETPTLSGVTIYVSKHTQEKERGGPSDQKYLFLKAESMGAIFTYTFTSVVTHIIHTGKPNLLKEVSAQKLMKCLVVSPLWVHACFEKQKRLPESEYPPLMKAQMLLSLSSQSQKLGGSFSENSENQKSHTAEKEDHPAPVISLKEIRRSMHDSLLAKRTAPEPKATAAELAEKERTKEEITAASKKDQESVARETEKEKGSLSSDTNNSEAATSAKLVREKEKEVPSPSPPLLCSTSSKHPKKPKRADDEDSLPRTPHPGRILLPATPSISQFSNSGPLEHQNNANREALNVNSSGLSMTPQVIHDAEQFLSTILNDSNSNSYSMMLSSLTVDPSSKSTTTSTTAAAANRRNATGNPTGNSAHEATNTVKLALALEETFAHANTRKNSSVRKRRRLNLSTTKLRTGSSQEDSQRNEEDEDNEEDLTAPTQFSSNVHYENHVGISNFLPGNGSSKKSPQKNWDSNALAAKLDRHLELDSNANDFSNFMSQATLVNNNTNKTPRTPHKGKRYFVLSSMEENYKVDLTEKIKQLGGEVISASWSDKVTHVIVGQRPNRAIKCLCSIASGKWLLRSEYVAESWRVNKWTDNEEDYVWTITDVANVKIEQPDSADDDYDRMRQIVIAWGYWHEKITRRQQNELRRLLAEHNAKAGTVPNVTPTKKTGGQQTLSAQPIVDVNKLGAFSNWNVLVLRAAPTIKDDAPVKTLLESGGANVFTDFTQFNRSPSKGVTRTIAIYVEEETTADVPRVPDETIWPTLRELRKLQIPIHNVTFLLEYLEAIDRPLPNPQGVLVELDEKIFATVESTTIVKKKK